jgi:DNA modification methylase
MKSNRILQGNVLEVARALLAQLINCIVTSPPYYGLRDYGLPPTHWPEVAYAPMAGLPEITIPAMSCCLGLEDSIEAYVGHMVLVWRELWRVLRGDGVGFLNLGDSYATGTKASRQTSTGLLKNHTAQDISRIGTPDGLKTKDLIGIPWRVAFALQADGWYLRSDVIWAKPNPMPESVTDRPTKAHEYVFLLAKSERYWWDQEAIREENTWPDHNRFGNKNAKARRVKKLTGNMRPDAPKQTDRIGRNRRTVWSIATRPYKDAHFAVMPPALVEPCILAGCPSRVCAECGEPWVRVVERETELEKGRNIIGLGPKTLDNPMTQNGQKGSTLHHTVNTKTIAFTPACACAAPTRPGIVLDPFFGSGTVGEVAAKTGRGWLGIELNSEYVELARERIGRTQPALFAREETI